MKVLEVQLLDNGEIIWEDKNLRNVLHTTGEEFILKVLFSGEEEIPENYYLGLDSRSSLTASQTIEDLSEPSIANGYQRESVASNGEFTVGISGGINLATGPIVTFRATGGSWGPVRNIFLTNESDDSGYLIASIALSAPITLNDGQIVSMKLGFSLQDAT